MTTIQCPVCYSDYKNSESLPRYFFNLISSALQCGHTICSNCMSRLIRQNEIKCPICSSTTRFPTDADENHRANYLFANFSENNFELLNNQMGIKMTQTSMDELEDKSNDDNCCNCSRWILVRIIAGIFLSGFPIIVNSSNST